MIDGAMVTATGGSRGAGIGGGYACHNPCDIKIYSGTVIATGLYGAAGIGGGEDGAPRQGHDIQRDQLPEQS